MRAKQMENLAKYTAACIEIGVAQSHTFDSEDLYDGRRMAPVVKNIHALAQAAHKLADYRGPQMGPKARDAPETHLTSLAFDEAVTSRASEWPSRGMRLLMHSCGVCSCV